MTPTQILIIALGVLAVIGLIILMIARHRYKMEQVRVGEIVTRSRREETWERYTRELNEVIAAREQEAPADRFRIDQTLLDERPYVIYEAFLIDANEGRNVLYHEAPESPDVQWKWLPITDPRTRGLYYWGVSKEGDAISFPSLKAAEDWLEDYVHTRQRLRAYDEYACDLGDEVELLALETHALENHPMMAGKAC